MRRRAQGQPAPRRSPDRTSHPQIAVDCGQRVLDNARVTNLLFDVTLALGLAMDALALSLVIGALLPPGERAYALRPALVFGVFQAAMTIIGWGLASLPGIALPQTTIAIIVFVILLGLGAKMIWEGLRGDAQLAAIPTWPLLLGMGVATSLDALAAGVGVGLMHQPIGVTATWVGLVTGVLSFAGVLGGRLFAKRLGRRPMVVGGVVLIALGVKALVA